MEVEKYILKHQQADALFKETFSIVIEQFGNDRIHYIGRKMYINLGPVIISVEFTGATSACGNIAVSAITKQGIIDQNITPFAMIFKESKSKSGLDKLVNLKVALNVTGEYTYVWSCELPEEDKVNLNHFVLEYAELFSSLYSV